MCLKFHVLTHSTKWEIPKKCTWDRNEKSPTSILFWESVIWHFLRNSDIWSSLMSAILNLYQQNLRCYVNITHDHLLVKEFWISDAKLLSEHVVNTCYFLQHIVATDNNRKQLKWNGLLFEYALSKDCAMNHVNHSIAGRGECTRTIRRITIRKSIFPWRNLMLLDF